MQLKNIGNSANAVKDIQNTLDFMANFKGLQNKNDTIAKLIEITSKYNVETLKLASSQVTLSTAQAKGIFSAKNLEGAELEQAVATATLSASQKKATASTGTLGTAFKGLGAKIKATTASMWTFLITTPAGWATLAVTAIGSVVAGVYAYNKAIDKAVDNAKEKLSEVASEYDEVTSKIAENNEKIKELEVLRKSGNLSIVDSEDLDELKAQNEELRIRQQYLEMQKENANQDIVEASKKKYNRDYGRKNTTDSSIESYKEELRKPKSQGRASSYLTGEGGSQYQSSTPYAAGQQDALDEESDTLTALIAKYQYYEEEKAKAVQAGDGESIEKYNAKLEETAEKLIEDRTALQGFRDDLSLTGESSTELDDVADKLKLIDDTLLSNGRQLIEFINAKSFSDQKAKLVELADTGKLTTESLSESFPELSAYLEENGLELQDLIGVLRDYKAELETVADSGSTLPLSISDTITKLDTQLRPALDALKKSYQEIFTDDGFTLENVDISMLNNVLKVMNEMKEAGLGIDTSGFENLARVLTDSSSTAEQVQGAFDSLATSILNSTDITGNLTDETASLVASLLEEMGVVNASELVSNQMALAKEKARLATLDLANATQSSMTGLLNEANASGVTRAEIYALAAAEIAYGNNGLDFSGKIAQLQNLAAAYGDTATQALLAGAADRVANGHGTYESVMADMMAQFNKAKGSVQIDFNGNSNSGAKSASKAGKEAADAYVDAFEKELQKLDDLKSQGKISEKQYLDALRRLYVKYFNQKKKYLDQYEKYESQYLQGKLYALCYSNIVLSK